MLNDETSTPQPAPAKKTVLQQQPEVYSALGTKNGDEQRKERDQSINEFLKDAVIRLREQGAPATNEILYSPLDRAGRVSSPYGNRVHPVTGKPDGHPALDITTDNKENVNVTAMRSGTVLYRGYFSPNAGNSIMVLTDNGELNFYAHLEPGSALHVHAGERVRQGQIIGVMGSTGKATERHVHVTVRKLPPETLLVSAKAQAEQLPGYVAPVIIDGNTGLPMPSKPLEDPAFDYENYQNIYPSIGGLTYRKGDTVAAPPRQVLMSGNPMPPIDVESSAVANVKPIEAMPVIQADEMPTESNLPANLGKDASKGTSVPPLKR